ncbi:AAA family ATPase [Herbiconiux sp. CPCC 205763]|uniref:AAA family ATPase n=1 Tax=Herbiconiux aconitum TaxID=2970913 RepID=A0ABT2GZ40_9MICO|nr:LuxR family transcriptional regulator [Herbiconiux aconitum]MCS5720199.1 AAA family ATPase [Herbiconiux aconitum]
MPRALARIIGRDRELDRLNEFVQSIQQTGSSLVLVGVAGIGKSSLVHSAAELAGGAGLTVLATAGLASEREIPFAALERLLHPALCHLSELPDPHRTVLSSALGLEAGAPAQSQPLFDAVLALVERAAAEAPVLVVVDDLDLVDESTAAVVAHLCGGLSAMRVGVLGSARNRTEWGEGTAHLLVDRLAHSDADRLLRTVEPSMPSFARAALLDHAAGNPLAILEAVAPTRGVPHFRAQIDALSPRTREALLLMALSKSPAGGSLALADVTIEDLVPAEAVGLIAFDADGAIASFSHPLIRGAIVDRASFAERQAAHLALASRSSIGLEEEAFHRAEAAVDPDEATASLLERAARSAVERGATSSAAYALTRAAQVSPVASESRRRLAHAAYLASDSAADDVIELHALSGIGLVGADSGSMHAAVAAAFHQLESGSDSQVVCRAVKEAIQTAPHGWNAADTELRDAMNSWMLLCWLVGREEEWREYRAAVAQLRPHTPELASGIFFDVQSIGLPAVSELIEAGRHGESRMAYIRSLASMALYHFGTGQWGEAERLVEEGMSVARDVPADPVVGILHYVAALLSATSGQVQKAVDSIDALNRLATRLGALGLARFGYHAHVLTAVAQGDWESAYRHAISINAPGGFPDYVPHARWVAYDLVEAALRTGRIDEARIHAAAMVETGLPAISPRLALLTHAAAGLTSEEGWHECFERALSVSQADEWAFDYARVQLEFGSRLRRERQAGAAHELLRAAMTAFDTVGAEPWARRTHQELRALGDRATATTPRNTLTAQELAIAELAAEGFSNKQIGARMFLSARTVSGHLYRVFPKLGIGTRSALRDALGPRSLEPAQPVIRLAS